MKTYPLHILRKALLEIINRDKYIKFTLYTEPTISTYGKHIGKKIGGKPLKLKGRINNIFASNKGLIIEFKHLWFSRQCRLTSVNLLLKDIRWIDMPFDEQKLENLCIEFIKKLN